MMNYASVKIEPDGEVKISGVEHGEMLLVAVGKGTFTVYEKGHSYWSGHALPRGYARAQYRVFQIDPERIRNYGEQYTFRAVELMRFDAQTNEDDRWTVAATLVKGFAGRVAV